MKKGWGNLFNSRKWHYFIEGKSLCGKWMLMGNGNLVDGQNDSPDNCAACRKKLAARSTWAQGGNK